MMSLKENFVVDKEGHKIGVFLDITTYEQLVDDLEELADIRTYDEALSTKEDAIPYEQAIKEIEEKRNI